MYRFRQIERSSNACLKLQISDVGAMEDLKVFVEDSK